MNLDDTSLLGRARAAASVATASARGDVPPSGRRPRGVALVLALTSITILTIFSLEFSYESQVAIRTSANVEREVKAYFHARAGVELATLVIGSTDLIQELINKYKAFIPGGGGGAMPNVSIAGYACEFVNAFCKGTLNLMGMELIDLRSQKGIMLSDGECGCTSADEDGRINLNLVGSLDEKQAVFDKLYKVLERHEGVTRVGELDKAMVQVALNVVDWADKDTHRTDLDLKTGKLTEGSGAESSGKFRYKVKDAHFDTTEEVRLVEGMDDKLWCKLRDQLTVYATEKLNVNTAPIEVIKALICKNLANRAMEPIACARGYGENPFVPVDVAGRYIEVCRTLKKLIFSPAFASEQSFVQFFNRLGMVLPPDYVQVLQIDPGRMLADVGTKGKIVRIVSKGQVGNVEKKVTAILDTQAQRFVYWRED